MISIGSPRCRHVATVLLGDTAHKGDDDVRNWNVREVGINSQQLSGGGDGTRSGIHSGGKVDINQNGHRC